MNKFIATVICLVVLSAASLPVAAQTRRRQCNNRTVYSTRQDSRYRTTRYDNTAYRNDNYRYDDYRYDDDYYGDNRSVWEKHRDKITTAAGAGGGAAIGAMVGGKKGAIIGAIAGGAGAAIYTYKIRDKNRRY